MGKREVVSLTKEQIAEINCVLSAGQRVELIPTKDGIRIIRIIRHNMMEPTRK